MLINKSQVESYAVSMESQTIWIILNAGSKSEVDEILAKSPLHKYWSYTIEELFVLDGQQFRFPTVQLN